MRIVFRYLGFLLLISSFLRLLPLGVALIYGESIWYLLWSGLLSIVVGLALILAYKKDPNKEEGLNLYKGFILASLSFILLPLIGAISFLPSFEFNFLNAFFESISGYTTTGFTLYGSLNELPKSLLLLRAEIQWIGGLGVISFFLFLISRVFLQEKYQLSEAENISKDVLVLYKAQGFLEKFPGGSKRVMKSFILVYGIFTLLGIVALSISGMNIIDAMGMTFASLSTGGFSMSDTFYNNDAQLIILSVLMLLGSISFFAHIRLFQNKIGQFLSYAEKNIFLLILILAGLISLAVTQDFRVISFEIISAFTTTGYSITNISLLPQLFIFILVLGMLIGGGLASTSGGIKVSRVYYLLSALPWYVKKLYSPPHAVIPLKIHNKTVEEHELASISIFVVLYVFIIVLGIIIFSLFGYSFLDSSFQIISALGTVGLQTMDLNTLNWFLKCFLILLMLLGRLEIFPILILIKKVVKDLGLVEKRLKKL